MKKMKISILTILVLFAFVGKPKAQGWCQDRAGVYSIGLGGTNAVLLGDPYGYTYPAFYGAGGSLNISGEYHIARFVGLGFQTGIDVFNGPPYRTYPHYAAIGIPIAIKCNVHILEAAKARIADRLDVYAGLNLGGGPAFFVAPRGGGTYAFIQAGPTIGVRYWLNHQIGIFGEFGWGATFANIGFSF